MDQEYINLTQAITGIISVLITCLGTWIAYKTLKRTPEQPPVADSLFSKLSENQSSISIGSEHPNELVVLKTKNQCTKLISTKNGIECYLFDLRPEKESGLQWQLSIDNIKKILEINELHVTSGFKINYGNFSIGPFENWLYSKDLFPNPKILRHRLMSLLNLSIKN